MSWGAEVEVERWRRIKVAVWAYAYEIESNPLVDDDTFDQLALLIRPELATGHAKLDLFFRQEFSPYTGMWVHRHPEKRKLARLCARLRRELHRRV